MAIKTFTWQVDVGSGAEFNHRTLVARFGDGYAQEVADGINNETQIWTVSMFGTRSALAPALAFLREHKGYVPFVWTTPNGQQLFVKGKEIKMQSEGADTYTLTAKFEQTYSSST